MPGGSPRFRDADSIERLYDDMRILFAEIAQHFQGMTLKEFRTKWEAALPAQAQAAGKH
jgi:hypothetical protein